MAHTSAQTFAMIWGRVLAKIPLPRSMDVWYESAQIPLEYCFGAQGRGMPRMCQTALQGDFAMSSTRSRHRSERRFVQPPPPDSRLACWIIRETACRWPSSGHASSASHQLGSELHAQHRHRIQFHRRARNVVEAVQMQADCRANRWVKTVPSSAKAAAGLTDWSEFRRVYDQLGPDLDRVGPISTDQAQIQTNLGNRVRKDGPWSLCGIGSGTMAGRPT